MQKDCKSYTQFLVSTIQTHKFHVSLTESDLGDDFDNEELERLANMEAAEADNVSIADLQMDEQGEVGNGEHTS